MSSPSNNDNDDENNPFVAFRKAIDAQASNFFSILTELPIQLSAIQDDLRKDGEAATENIQSALKRLGDAYERSTNPERRQIEDPQRTVPESKEKEKEVVYTRETQNWQEENFRNRWSLDDGELKFSDLPKPPPRRAWPDRSFFAFSPYSPLALEQRFWHNPWTNPNTYLRREIIWRDAFEDLLRTTQAAHSQTRALAEYQLQFMVLEHQKNQRLMSAGNAASDSSPPLPLYKQPTPARWLRRLCDADLIHADNFHTLAHLVDTTTASSAVCGDPAKFPPTRDPYRDAGPQVARAQGFADAWIREHPTMYPSGPLRMATTTTSTTTVRTSLNDGRHVTSTVTETHFPDGSVQTTSDVSQQVDGATAPAKGRNEEWEERLKEGEAGQHHHEAAMRRHRELQQEAKQRVAALQAEARIRARREMKDRAWAAAGGLRRREPMEKNPELGLWPEVDRRVYRALKREFEEEMRREVGLGREWWNDDEETAEVMPDVAMLNPGGQSGNKTASGQGALKWTWSTKWGDEDGNAEETARTTKMKKEKEKEKKEEQEEMPDIKDNSASGKIGGMDWSWSTKWGGKEDREKEKAKVKEQAQANAKVVSQDQDQGQGQEEVEEARKANEWSWGFKWGEEREREKAQGNEDAKAKERDKAKEKVNAKQELRENESMSGKENSGNKSWSWYWSW